MATETPATILKTLGTESYLGEIQFWETFHRGEMGFSEFQPRRKVCTPSWFKKRSTWGFSLLSWTQLHRQSNISNVRKFNWSLKRTEIWKCTIITTLTRTQAIKGPNKSRELSAAGEIFESIDQDSAYVNRNFTNPCRWINVLAKIIDFQYIPVWTFSDTGIFPVYFTKKAFFQYIFQHPAPVQVFPVYSSIFQYRWPPCFFCCWTFQPPQKSKFSFSFFW